MSTSVSASVLTATSVRGSSSESGYKIINSHLHVLAEKSESFTHPYADGQTSPLPSKTVLREPDSFLKWLILALK